MCGRRHDGPQLMRITLGRRRGVRGTLRATGTRGHRIWRLTCLVVLLTTGCARSVVSPGENLLAHRPACLTLDWGATRPITEHLPSGIQLNPRPADSAPWPGDSDHSGPVEALPPDESLHQGWYWRMRGDTLRFGAMHPTMDDLQVTLPNTASTAQAQWVFLNGERGTVQVRHILCPPSRRSAA